MAEIRTCEWCGSEYISRRLNSATCSPKCTAERRNQKNKAAYRQKKKATKTIRVCKICNDTFITMRSSQLCCSESCTAENRIRMSKKLHEEQKYHEKIKQREARNSNRDYLSETSSEGIHEFDEEDFAYTKLLKKLMGESRVKNDDKSSGLNKILKIRALEKIRSYIDKLSSSDDESDRLLAKRMKLEREYIRTREKIDLKKAISKAFNGQNPSGVYTLSEIGKVLGVTRERVRQLEQAGEKSLKHPSVARILKSYTKD